MYGYFKHVRDGNWGCVRSRRPGDECPTRPTTLAPQGVLVGWAGTVGSGAWGGARGRGGCAGWRGGACGGGFGCVLGVWGWRCWFRCLVTGPVSHHFGSGGAGGGWQRVCFWVLGGWLPPPRGVCIRGAKKPFGGGGWACRHALGFGLWYVGGGSQVELLKIN